MPNRPEELAIQELTVAPAQSWSEEERRTREALLAHLKANERERVFEYTRHYPHEPTS